MSPESQRDSEAADRSRLIVNTHGQLLAAIAAGYQWPYAIMSSNGPLGDSINSWQVYHPLLKTDKKASWYDYGRKTFQIIGQPGDSHAECKRAALAEAQQWVDATYGYKGKWKRNSFGDYVPAEIQARWPIPKRDI